MSKKVCRTSELHAIQILYNILNCKCSKLIKSFVRITEPLPVNGIEKKRTFPLGIDECDSAMPLSFGSIVVYLP